MDNQAGMLRRSFIKKLVYMGGGAVMMSSLGKSRLSAAESLSASSSSTKSGVGNTSQLHSQRMKDLIEFTSTSLATDYPSPFGASIYDAEGKLIVQTYDTVIKDGDPTSHGEVNAIRKAVRIVDSMSLKGCTIYSTCEPCSMCMSSIIWADIDVLVFGATVNEDASKYWQQPLDITASEIADRMLLSKCEVIPEVERPLAQKLFEDWKAVTS